MDLDFTNMRPQLQLLVSAIQKGVGEDIREYLLNSGKYTNNAVRAMLGDNIFTNISKYASSEALELRKFRRFAWEGCIIIDRAHKLTYSICSKRTFEGIPKKKERSFPHYLQSILFVQNSTVQPKYIQPYLFGYDSESNFSPDVYFEDYASIMGDFAGDGYIHWCIVYEASHSAITHISMVKLDRNFSPAEEINLDDLLKPDFSELTGAATETEVKDAHSLISLKPAGMGKTPDPVQIGVKISEEEMLG